MLHGQAYRAIPAVRKSPSGLTVTGQGVSLRVRGHELQITDGFPLESSRQTRKVTRARSRFDRILFTAGSGFVTVDALDWCAENGVPIVAVSQSGMPRWTLVPGAGNVYPAPLRRAQALAPFTETGVEIARWLIQRKIAGQRDVLRDLLARLGHRSENAWPHTTAPDAVAALDALLPRLGSAETIATVRSLESEAAAVYWDGLSGAPVHFAPQSHARMTPSHWRTFAGRGSPLTGGNRSAADPANAILNYAYALLEAVALLTIHEAGLDPYLAILHTDTEGRRSLVYDVLEPVRPMADRLVLSLLLSHAFRPGELHLLRDGRCRLDQDLCGRLWPWMPTFRQALGPVMTFLLGQLRRGPRYGDYKAYRLVEVTPPSRTRAPLGQKRWAREASAPAISSITACRSCGVLLDDVRADRLYCDDCAPPVRAVLGAKSASVAREVLAQRRDEGSDPAHGGEAARRRAAAISRANRARMRWNKTIGEDTMANGDAARAQLRELLPQLRRLPLSQIAKALGVTRGYASFVRRGLRTPHPRHLRALHALAQGAEGS